MAGATRITWPPRPGRLTEVLRIKGAPVYVHWTMFAVAALMLAGAALATLTIGPLTIDE